MKNIITRSICCDILLPITNYNRFVYFLTKASENPQWLRHSFVVITDGLSSSDEKAMEAWYYENRVKKPMPEVTIMKTKNSLEKNITAQYNSLLMAGSNPYVYFQNENDELPINIDKAIYFLYHNKDVDIVMGKCETFLEDKTPIEVFPMTTIQGDFLYDCELAMRLFPSYLHPLSSVMRKRVFSKVPYYDPDKNFKDFAFYYFILRCVEFKKAKIEYVPYTIKISNRKRENAITMSAGLRQRLVHDIRLWVNEFPESENKTFQMDILNLLEKGEITTFKEIDARVEDYIDNL